MTVLYSMDDLTTSWLTNVLRENWFFKMGYTLEAIDHLGSWKLL